MGAPIRSSTEIDLIINRAQHALGDLGTELIEAAKRGEDSTNNDTFRDNMYRLIVLRIQLQNILTDDGEVKAFYEDADNEKKFNKILDGIARLSQFYSGSAIPLLTGKRIPLYFFPSTAGLGTGGNTNSGSGQANPGGTTFENLSVDSPGEQVDSFDASTSNFALYTYSVYGNNSGEGSRTGMIIVSIRNSSVTLSEVKTPDNGGITSPLTFSAAINSGMLELTADATTDGWVVRGVRILFQNITFQNPLGPLPTGGLTAQVLRKISGTDYDVEWATVVWAMLTDVTASLTEINYVNGVTSPIQTQLDALTAAVALRLLKAGDTMSGNLAMGGNKVTGLGAASGNGEALRYEQLVGLYLLLTGGTMSGNIAMGGNKVTGLGAATTAGDAVRYEQVIGAFLPLTGGVVTGTLEVQGGIRTQTSGSYLKEKIITIGDWDLTSAGNKSIAHGLSDYTKIRRVDVMIRNDSATKYYDFLKGVFTLNTVEDINGAPTSTILPPGGVSEIDSTNIILYSMGTLFFDGEFNATSYNRGYVTITYEA